MSYLALLLAGMLLCNGIPHVVAGLLGQRFFTPWTPPGGTKLASPVQNFLWGAGNLLAGLWIVRHFDSQNVPHGAMAAGLGFLAAGTFLSGHFAKGLEVLRKGGK
ncbi:hypothetical protein [Novosphingobium sp. B 225]|uniref:hypothetical protein n=1 Tax=Novosphingobium sp. B 225 TaxID=1961849 RepID=UPI000B4C130A|nr:hypothetical protein [Novosphingobium sp. B 225]